MTKPAQKKHDGADLSAPIFILAAPLVHGAHLAAMLGQNPKAFDLPETNLFVKETLHGLTQELSGIRASQMHGLYRALALLLTGEQSPISADMAKRWVFERLHWPTPKVLDFLCDKVAPLRAVDRLTSIIYTEPGLDFFLSRYKRGKFVHVTCHPRTHGAAIMGLGQGAIAKLLGGYDETLDTPELDPQVVWLKTEKTIAMIGDHVGRENIIRVRIEDVLSAPHATMKTLCQSLGLATDANSLAAMSHPENSPFSKLGPIGMHMGNDADFFRNPTLPASKPAATLKGHLEWRGDGMGFLPEVKDIARSYGYE